MSGNGWKKPLYQVAEWDSKGMRKMGRMLGWEGLEEEGDRNAKNPGRAVGKAAQYAATYYLGGLLGGAGEAAGAGADAAAVGAGEVATISAQQAAEQVAAEMAKQAAQQTAQEGVKQGLLETGKTAAQTGWNSLKDGVNSIPKAIGGSVDKGIYNAMIPGAGSQQASLLAQQTGDFGAYGLGKTMEAAAGAEGLQGWQQALGQYGGKAASLLGKNGPDGVKAYMKAQQLMGIMSPQQQPQQMPQQMRQPQQQQPEPLNNPYGAGGNSLGLLGMSEEDKKKLRAMGYRV